MRDANASKMFRLIVGIVQGLDGLGLEISNLVDIKMNMDYELAMRISSSIKSGNTFYTDLNGFQVWCSFHSLVLSFSHFGYVWVCRGNPLIE